MLIMKNGSLSFGSQTIFDELSFSIAYDQKIGVLGRNGAGKSTLLKVISGQQSLDSGVISYDKKKTIAYMPQEEVINSHRTVFEEACSAFDHFLHKEKRLQEIQHALDAGASAAHAEKMLEEYNQLQQDLMAFDKEEAFQKVKEVLKGLGFSEERMHQSVHHLSVGWQMRVNLARLLLKDADFYLFDEPTNHLDLPAKEWFLSFLMNAPFGYLLVTHDRHFLEHGCNELLELERGKGTMYYGTFSFYLKEKEARQAKQRDAYIQQQKEITRTKSTIERFRASASKAKMAQSMIKKLDKIELIEMEPELPSISFSFPETVRPGKIVLELENIEHRFNDKILFDHISCSIKRGQKVALIAANGMGKTTLFNIIVGNIPAQKGTVTFGYNVTYAYFEQEQSRILKPENTVFEEVLNACPSGVSESTVRGFLGSFLFKGGDVYKKIKNLSGGEKNRVAMVKVLLQNANFLILDEPTNHLDIYAKDILLQALKQYTGTILLVSHDHDFIQKCADSILELTPHELISFEGDYEGYLYYKKTMRPSAASQTELAHKAQTPVDNGKQKEKDVRMLERTVARLESALEQAGLKLSECDYGSDEYEQKYKHFEKVQKELADAVQAWEESAR